MHCVWQQPPDLLVHAHVNTQTRAIVRARTTYTHTQVCPIGRDTIQTRIYQIFLAYKINRYAYGYAEALNAQSLHCAAQGPNSGGALKVASGLYRSGAVR